MNNTSIVFIWIVLIFSGCSSIDVDSDIDNSKSYHKLHSTKYDAVALNNQVSSIQKGVVRLIETVFKSDTLTVEQELSDAIFDLDVSASRLNSLGQEHEMAEYFSQSVIELINFYKNEFEGDFVNVVSILKKKELSDADKIYLNQYDQNFADKEAVVFNNILVRQDSFANYFNIGLTD